MHNPRKNEEQEELPSILRGRLVAGDPATIAALKAMQPKRRNPKRVTAYPWERITQKEFVEGLGGVWPM